MLGITRYNQNTVTMVSENIFWPSANANTFSECLGVQITSGNTLMYASFTVLENSKYYVAILSITKDPVAGSGTLYKSAYYHSATSLALYKH